MHCPGLYNFSGYIVFLAELRHVMCWGGGGGVGGWVYGRHLLDVCFQLQQKPFQS